MKNDAIEALQDARDALKAIAEDIGETRRVGIIQDALSAADSEIVRLEKALRGEASQEGWKPTPDHPLFDEAALVDEIARIWGLHGAHMEVYRMALLDAARYRFLRGAYSVMPGKPGASPIEWYCGTEADRAVDNAMEEARGDDIVGSPE